MDPRLPALVGLVQQGQTPAGAARALGLSPDAVEVYRQEIERRQREWRPRWHIVENADAIDPAARWVLLQEIRPSMRNPTPGRVSVRGAPTPDLLLAHCRERRWRVSCPPLGIEDP